VEAVTAQAPAAHRVRRNGAISVGSLNISPDIMSSVAETAAHMPVELRGGKVRFHSVGGGAPLTLSAKDFASEGFSLNCSAMPCGKDQIFISSPLTGRSGFVSSAALARRDARTFAADIDPYSGVVPTRQFAQLDEFLSAIKSENGNPIVELAIVDAGKADVNADIDDAERFLIYARQVTAKALNIPLDRVAVLSGIQVDKGLASRCLSTGRKGLCFTAQATNFSKP
jgi:hypothetical protein